MNVTYQLTPELLAIFTDALESDNCTVKVDTWQGYQWGKLNKESFFSPYRVTSGAYEDASYACDVTITGRTVAFRSDLSYAAAVRIKLTFYEDVGTDDGQPGESVGAWLVIPGKTTLY